MTMIRQTSLQYGQRRCLLELPVAICVVLGGVDPLVDVKLNSDLLCVVHMVEFGMGTVVLPESVIFEVGESDLEVVVLAFSDVGILIAVVVVVLIVVVVVDFVVVVVVVEVVVVGSCMLHRLAIALYSSSVRLRLRETLTRIW